MNRHRRATLRALRRMKRADFVHSQPENYRPPQYAPESVKTLEATNEFGVHRSTWRRVDGIWSCTHTEPRFKWLKGMNPTAAKMALIQAGCSLKWI